MEDEYEEENFQFPVPEKLESEDDFIKVTSLKLIQEDDLSSLDSKINLDDDFYEEEEDNLDESIQDKVSISEAEEEYDRRQLVDEYYEVVKKEKNLSKINANLQKKLAAQFKSRKIDDFIIISTETDVNAEYNKMLIEIDELCKKEEEEQEKQMEKERALTMELLSKQSEVNAFIKTFNQLKKEVAINATYSQNNQKIPIEQINQYLEKEAIRDEEIRKARLINIKENMILQKLKDDLRKRKEGNEHEGIHYNEYRRLQIEIHTNHMQIEKQTQEYKKMENIFINLTQLLTHTKEKLAVLEPEITNAEQHLKELSEEVLKKTELLGQLKEKKKIALHKLEMLKRHCGILGDKKLMKYYDEMKHAEQDIRAKIIDQKNKYQKDHKTLIDLEKRYKMNQITQFI